MWWWWKKLKAGKKGAVVFGGAHLIIFTLVLAGAYIRAPQGEASFGYFLVFMELPWMMILTKLGIEPMIFGSTLFWDIVIRGIIGTFFYALVGAAVFWIFDKKIL